ncbi:hypothetical protein EWE75_12190 [Sphingomonas populi]|uniref:Uncharacterized protein n=1 Tax=Sphingomonas populi TaxID=2484750 RepID=A0A4Q6Y4G2_9SPHN|nr:hypothetical protein [Sphingomonas populi]RZF64299.1 hypothetical protein EWE75_12190 [Sphingomonas populi]
MAEKPFGWRPLSDEKRQELVALGFDAKTIEELEDRNIYSPGESGVWAYRLAQAMLYVAGAHLGPDFITAVKAVLEAEAAHLAKSEDAEDLVEAPMVQRLIKFTDWESLMRRARNPEGTGAAAAQQL